MAEAALNIVRRAGDTYPTKSTIKINGVAIDLSGWDVLLKYRDDNKKVMVIKAIITDKKHGKVSIFPHAVAESETLLDYEDFVSKEMAAAGDTRTVNQVWDEDEANKEYPFHIVRVRKFGKYQEEHTHTVGKVQLLSRWG